MLNWPVQADMAHKITTLASQWLGGTAMKNNPPLVNYYLIGILINGCKSSSTYDTTISLN